MKRRSGLALASLLALSVPGAIAPALADDAPPAIVASIPPVHSLVAKVMMGVGEPALLIPATASPHHFTLRPSDARMLADADLVFWVGPQLETALTGPLDALATSAHRVALMDAPDIELLPVREGGVWGKHTHHDHGDHAHDDHDDDDHEEHAHDDHGHDDDDHEEHAHDDHDHDDDDHEEHAHDDHGHDDDDHEEHAHDDHGEIDAHIWLDTDNAQAIVRAVAAALSERDPAHAETYARNRDAALAELATLAEQLDATLAPVRDRPFLVLHDGYQYFEHEFGLTAAGAVTISPEVRPGARRIGELRDVVRARNVACIFGEPQAGEGTIRTVAEDSGARLGLLDPLGADLQPGPNLYPQMMTGLAGNVAGCLALGG